MMKIMLADIEYIQNKLQEMGSGKYQKWTLRDIAVVSRLVIITMYHSVEHVLEMEPELHGIDTSQPINNWFELSYAQFLTVPRLVMESMPKDWQRKMAALLTEMDNTFDWRPEEGRYWVRLKDNQGRFCDAPLNDYRRGNIEHLRRQKTE